jgi:ferredoxin-NADP reductase
MDLLEFALERVVEESESVRTLVFSGKVPPYKPGNFFRLWLADGNGKKSFRPYSAASHPSEGVLRLCIKKEGEFSGRAWKLREGDIAQMDGPYGNFMLAGADSKRVFVAGGVGIAPLRGMILQTLLEGKEAALFHSARTFSDVTYIGEMKALELQTPLFRYYPAVTREEMPDGFDAIRGRISAKGMERRLGSLEGRTFYICGPPDMVSSVVNDLQSSGVPKEKIRKEEWG